MKKTNIWKIIWLVGVYVILLFILYLVIIYKVKWEDKDLNRYLYFYNCNGNLCTADTRVNKYYSSVVCPNRECPYVKEVRGDLVILSNTDKEYLYNYRDNKVISDKYKTYSFTSSDKYYVVSDDSNLYGVIDNEGKVIVDASYELITDYYDGFIAFAIGEKHGITNIEKKINIDPKYDNVILINDKIFAYVNENNYYIASYENKESDDPYSYLYVYNGAILTIKNGQISILDYNLNQRGSSIGGFFPYTREQERATLRIKTHDNILEFSVKNEENEYDKYICHTKEYHFFKIS